MVRLVVLALCATVISSVLWYGDAKQCTDAPKGPGETLSAHDQERSISVQRALDELNTSLKRQQEILEKQKETLKKQEAAWQQFKDDNPGLGCFVHGDCPTPGEFMAPPPLPFPLDILEDTLRALAWMIPLVPILLVTVATMGALLFLLFRLNKALLQRTG